MTTRYTEKQIEGVARILSWHTTAAGVDEDQKRMEELGYLCGHFADLFAADNPPGCSVGGHDGPCKITTCLTRGFYRAQFLAACGLESER